jgi:ferritin-like metal-binding protein YciE
MTMGKAEERLMQWLRDAHAMEKQAEQMLSALAGRIENYPQLKAQIEQHIQETKEQARRLETCIHRRGGSTSAIKDVAGKMTAMAQGISGIFVGDEIIKGSLAGYTFEHMEIASYRILMAAADALGDVQTASICEKNLSEEEAMAEWLAENIEPLTREYLNREENAYAEAKR